MRVSVSALHHLAHAALHVVFFCLAHPLLVVELSVLLADRERLDQAGVQFRLVNLDRDRDVAGNLLRSRRLGFCCRNALDSCRLVNLLER